MVPVTKEQIKASANPELAGIPDVDDRHKKWFIDEFEQFCKHKALESAIPKAQTCWKKRVWCCPETGKRRSTTWPAKHMGTDYWADPGRIEKVRNSP